MINRPVLLLKARPKIPTMISGHARADGADVKPHIALRGGGQTPSAEGAPPLEAFIARHGGPERFRAALADMNPEQKAKLVEAMGHLDAGGGPAVLERLSVDSPPTSPTAFEAEPAAEGPPQAPPAAPPPEAKSVDLGGIHGELGDMANADDREDLADAMVRDPHSEESTSLLKRIAKRLFG